MNGRVLVDEQEPLIETLLQSFFDRSPVVLIVWVIVLVLFSLVEHIVVRMLVGRARSQELDYAALLLDFLPCLSKLVGQSSALSVHF